jgi:hypothetical protein
MVKTQLAAIKREESAIRDSGSEAWISGIDQESRKTE